ncbi:MAG: AsmA family protein, partial [Geminicoccaceae bacterium]|nr:AsmA family protein [Geminicoccaceae bacterium]
MKKLLIALLVLVVLVIGGLLAAPFLIPVDTYKRQVEAQVEAATGRALTIDGPVDLSFFPSVALEAGSVRLANVQGAAEVDMVRLEALEVELKVLPLLGGSVEVDRFVLIEPQIHLEVDEQGTPNWQLGGPAAETTGGEAPDAPEEQGEQPAEAPADGGGLPISELKLGDIRIEDGTLTFRDATSGVNERVENIDLSLDLPDLKSRLQADGTFDYKGKTVEIGLGLDQLLAMVEGGSSPISARIEAEPVGLTFEGLVDGGAAAGARGALDLDVRAIRDLAAWLAQPLDFKGDGVRSLAIAGKLDASPARIAFNDASIVFDDIKAEGEVSADLRGPVPAVQGRLDVGEVDLNPYLPKPAAEDEAVEDEAEDQAPADAPAAEWSDEPIPIPKLDMAALDFELVLDKLKVDDLELDRTALAVTLENAVLGIDLKEFALYGGEGAGTFRLDTGEREPEITADFRLDGLQAQPFLAAAADFERLEGLAS